MPEDKRAFYEYHSCLMEPWDGPASIVFTDGKYIGAVLDRNGLRPSRYYLTHDDRVIMASEVGVLRIEPQNVKAKGRLQPGRMFLVDFEQGRLIPDEELKQRLRQPPAVRRVARAGSGSTSTTWRPTRSRTASSRKRCIERMQAFGYTVETMQFMLLPLVRELRDPVGSMGNDSCLACLSDKPRMLYDYFKQLFAQVTNPAIDSIREEVIMSLECYIGPERNLLETTRGARPPAADAAPDSVERAAGRAQAHGSPRLAARRRSTSPGRAAKASAGMVAGARPHLRRGRSRRSTRAIRSWSCRTARSAAIACRSARCWRPGPCIIIWCGKTKRTRIGIVVETGEAREVHHHCLLVGYGADAINPYLAFEALWHARREGLLQRPEGADRSRSKRRRQGAPGDRSRRRRRRRTIRSRRKITSWSTSYRKGVAKGMLKVMAKMGISTLQSYKGAQIFEAVGLRDEVIDRCFAGTASRIQGVDFDVLAEEALRRHALGYPEQAGRSAAGAAEPGRVPLAGRRRAPHVGSAGDRRSASRRAQQQRRRLPPVRRAREPRCADALRAARPARSSSRARTAARFRSTKSCRPRTSSSDSAPAR